MFERFTNDARDAVTHAVDEDAGLPSASAPQHVLLGAVRSPDTVAARALSQLGVDRARCVPRSVRTPSDGARRRRARRGRHRPRRRPRSGRGRVRSRGARRRRCSAGVRGRRPSPDGRPQAVRRRGQEAAASSSLREALRFKHKHIDTGHLLLAVGPARRPARRRSARRAGPRRRRRPGGRHGRLGTDPGGPDRDLPAVVGHLPTRRTTAPDGATLGAARRPPTARPPGSADVRSNRDGTVRTRHPDRRPQTRRGSGPP